MIEHTGVQTSRIVLSVVNLGLALFIWYKVEQLGRVITKLEEALGIRCPKCMKKLAVGTQIEHLRSAHADEYVPVRFS